MRNPLAKVMIAGLAVVTIWAAPQVQAQDEAPAQGQGQAAGRGGRGGGRGGRGGAQSGFVAPGVPKMPDAPGPAPKHDLSGIWVGPIKVEMGPFPAMTPAGQAAFKQNHPIARASDNATSVQANNDPFA